jgi:hypothetical protein
VTHGEDGIYELTGSEGLREPAIEAVKEAHRACPAFLAEDARFGL